MSAHLAESLVGVVLDDKYRIDRPLGAGGMGAVFRAEHLGTGRPVAIKTVLPKLIRSHEALERFRREARAAGSLRHPNIVDVTDFGVARVGDMDIAYLVMEYLEGRTLDTLLEERGSLSAEITVDIIDQIAVALDAAHRNGIVHRDLKPENIWLVPDARGGFVIRVLDFGIAKLREPEVGSSPAGRPTVPLEDQQGPSSSAETMVRSTTAPELPEPSASLPMEPLSTEETLVRPGKAGPHAAAGSPTPALTTAGTTLGTPAYMSPEQCAGADVTQRSDIYSLGVVAWQCLVGRRMFEGAHPDLIRQHLQDRPRRVDEENPALPKSLGVAVARALEKDPEDRYASAGAMAGTLRVAIEGPSTILRRSAILYLDRPEEFLRISVRASIPQLVALIPAIGIAWLLGSREITAFFAAFVGTTFWGFTTTITHMAFGVVIDQLRTRPLEPIDVDRVFGRLARRLGLDEKTSTLGMLPRLLKFYVLCELRAPAGQGDLAVQIALHEGLGPGEVKERCALLAVSTKRAYDRVRFVILGSIFAIPLFLGYVLFSFAVLIGFHHPDALLFAVSSAMLALPVIAVLINPLLSPALALLYFRARQANGEDVDLGAVVSSRL